MKYLNLHPWSTDYKTAVEIQGRLEKMIVLRNALNIPDLIAGADVSYTRSSNIFFASVVVFEFQTMKKVEAVTASGKVDFPYIPGLLSFRELPVLLKAFAKIRCKPDVIIFDGQGIAHPRGVGLASHAGLLLDTPSIGCAKTRLIGEHKAAGREAGCYSPLIFHNKVIGAVLRTRRNVKPVFVSPGHKIDLDTSIDLALRSCCGYRLPEPVREAHNLVKKTATGR